MATLTGPAGHNEYREVGMDISGFIIAILPVALSPGASFTLAVSNALHQGYSGLSKVIIGTGLGIFCHALLAGLGITALVTRQPALMHTLVMLGTLYLVYIAIRLIISGLRAGRGQTADPDGVAGIKTAWLANVLNAKAILLYLTVVPRFIGEGSLSLWNFGLLAGLHCLIMAAWLLLIGYSMMKAARKLNIHRLTQFINVGGGSLLLIFTLYPLRHLVWQILP